MYPSLPADEVCKRLNVTIDGLTSKKIDSLREQFGFNELPEKKKSLIKLFFLQFQDTMIYILFFALAISVAMPFLEGHDVHIGSFVDAFVILGILLLNAILGFVQEYKAEEAISMLKKLTSPHVRVRRDGVEKIIESRELLPGDIVIVEAGDKISADGRLINHSHLRVNESSLTGESTAVDKHNDPLKGEHLPIADQDNMLFSGTLVTRGFGEYVVTAIARGTQIGKIATLVSETEFPETPLQKRMKQLGKLLGTVVLALCVIIFAIGLFEKMPLAEILLITVSLAVSAVPEGLPAVVTVCLAMGVRRMVKGNALVRRLESLETLGSVTVICSDKTGTITQNKMTVVDWYVCDDSEKNLKLLAQIGASCNRAELPNIGDPTEIGLLEFGEKQAIDRLDISDELVPFTSEQKYMKTSHNGQIFLKGAPERITALAEGDHTKLLQQNEEFAKRGLRVLACAIEENDEVRVIGLVAMEDPPRLTATTAISQAKSAGIRTIMITGDNLITAQAIAKQVGIEGSAMHGSEIDQLTDEQLMETVEEVSVFARVSPEHKLRILEALKANKEIVAMSGDGVNDAPALKGAHVGISMGKIGTEVAREASSIVLADDHFATIVSAISEGRRIYDNIRKFVIFLLRTNFDELLFITTCIFLRIPLPYLALHILWINLLTDSLPALALGVEKAEPNVMSRPPKPASQHILANEAGRLVFAAVVGFSVSFLLYLYLLSVGTPLTEARSVTLTLAVVFELCAVVSMRSSRPIYEVGFFSNKLMLGAITMPIIFQLILLYSPLSTVFKIVSITAAEWAMVIAISLGGFCLFEGLKLIPVREKSTFKVLGSN